MKTNIVPGFLKKICTLTFTLIGIVFCNSCNRLHEDLDPCPQGLRIRFIYDYNMEYANAFPSQVDCLTVLFYDAAGNHITTVTNTTSDLKDENWRMTLPLSPGQYTILAYGGLACQNTSFSFVTNPESTPLTNIRVQLNPTCITSPVGTQLHPLFYGRLETTVEETSMEYKEVTVEMMKDTNNLRVILQQTDGAPLDNEDYDFRVIDNNTLFAWNNNLLPQPETNYMPWARGNASPGELDNGNEASVAWAEMSFPRLVTTASPRLQITHIETGKKVIDIPLNNYLLLLKSQEFSSMGSQEFLDRESRWNMIFFLAKNNYWINTSIVINDWVVRINDTKL